MRSNRISVLFIPRAQPVEREKHHQRHKHDLNNRLFVCSNSMRTPHVSHGFARLDKQHWSERKANNASSLGERDRFHQEQRMKHRDE